MSTQQRIIPRQKNFQSLFTTGLALFSMFFGAGNLIFPLFIGRLVGHHVWFAILGLGLTAVIVPLLGLIAMMLFQGDTRRFFGRLGTYPGVFLLLLLQLILGPFGVIPRLITLMHATIKPYFFEMPLMLFSALVGLLIFGSSYKRSRLIALLGVYLTPVLLLSLTALVFFGLMDGSSLSFTTLSAKESFLEGLLGGYNTMDLIAAFLFATVVLPHFQKEAELEHPAERQRSLVKKMVFSSLIAAFLLFLTYIGLCLISARHAAALGSDCPTEQMLGAIAVNILGPIGGSIAAIAIFTACLTTAMTLVSIFADYLRKDLCKGKISPSLAIILTLVAATLVANLGFGGIAAFLGPLLQVVYPGLIVLTLFNLFHWKTADV
ncbi:MAG: branched-chain amino acid transport system II carrier protein [Chlamydiales bacterium]|nr:branched-chain amino acid transport system II carrier protein [Chlamydiales bacterium]